MKVMSALEVAKARVDRLLCGTLSPAYADNTALAVDIALLTKEYGHLSHWAEQLDRGQRLLTHKITREAVDRNRAEHRARADAANAEREARAAREQAKRARHARNLNDRRERQRLEAAGHGSGHGKKRG